jgi:hypothetical protein
MAYRTNHGSDRPLEALRLAKNPSQIQSWVSVQAKDRARASRHRRTERGASMANQTIGYLIKQKLGTRLNGIDPTSESFASWFKRNRKAIIDSRIEAGAEADGALKAYYFITTIDGIRPDDWTVAFTPGANLKVRVYELRDFVIEIYQGDAKSQKTCSAKQKKVLDTIIKAQLPRLQREYEALVKEKVLHLVAQTKGFVSLASIKTAIKLSHVADVLNE